MRVRRRTPLWFRQARRRPGSNGRNAEFFDDPGGAASSTWTVGLLTWHIARPFPDVSGPDLQTLDRICCLFPGEGHAGHLSPGQFVPTMRVTHRWNAAAIASQGDATRCRRGFEDAGASGEPGSDRLRFRRGGRIPARLGRHYGDPRAQSVAACQLRDQPRPRLRPLNSITAPQFTQMRQASINLVTSLQGTPSQVGVYSYATFAPATNGSGGTANHPTVPGANPQPTSPFRRPPSPRRAAPRRSTSASPGSPG